MMCWIKGLITVQVSFPLQSLTHYIDIRGMSQKEEENIKSLQAQLTQVLSKNSKGQLEVDDVNESPYLHHDEHKPIQFRRAERLSLMLKCRMLLAKMYENITLLKSYYILDQGLMNFHFYCIGRLNSEKANLYQKKGFEIPAHLGSRIFEIHEKYITNTGKDHPLVSDEMLEIIQKTLLLEKCSLPHAYIWIQAKYQLVKILFQQARYDEVLIY